jgi:hypothetical protein
VRKPIPAIHMVHPRHPTHPLLERCVAGPRRVNGNLVRCLQMGFATLVCRWGLHHAAKRATAMAAFSMREATWHPTSMQIGIRFAHN